MSASRILVGVVFGTLLACGGGGSAPPASPPPSEPEPSTNAAPPAPTSEAADAAAPAPTASAAPTPPPEPADPCLPVGVDFEKRVRPKLKDCYREGKKKEPNLEGMAKIAVEVDTLGKIKSIKLAEKTLPEPVAQCMLKVVKSTPFPEASKCPGKAITIPVQFPTAR